MKFVKRIVIYLAGLFFVALGVAFQSGRISGQFTALCGKPDPWKRPWNLCDRYLYRLYPDPDPAFKKGFPPSGSCPDPLLLCLWIFVYLTETLLGSFCLPGYPGRLVMLAISIFLVAFGICLYLDTDLIVMPMEGLTAAMNKTVFPKKAFHEVKVILDCTVVVVGIVLCFVFLGELQGIREGTVLCALLVGKVMKPMQKVLVPTVKRFC